MMARPVIYLLLLVLAWVLAPGGAKAESLLLSLSTHRVAIASNFTGTDLVVFGLIERDGLTAARSESYDVAVVVRGPRRAMVARRKERVLGLWINRAQRRLAAVPGFVSILSTRPLGVITTPTLRARYDLSLAEAAVGDAPQDAFTDALVRLQQDEGLYGESNQVTFLSPTVFRATVALPPNVPVGAFDVEVMVFAGQARLVREGSAFEVVKIGIDEVIASMARDQPWLYGLMTAGLAALFGWGASVVLRRD